MPYLKKIEINGFKTFPSKTTITLDKGFTVITGPNGSGKTNIIDAVLFGLGELSARRLRAENFSNLIYQGNPGSNIQKKKKAKVVLRFDNSDGRIPVDTGTVTVSREIEESGQSVYRLNGRRISRSNLMDVLLMAGISPYGHNVVLQGTITRMAEISSNERRKTIEDMIGIAQYDSEKAQAEEKLKAADISIRTAMGQVSEVQRRVEDLERERNDLLRFKFIQNEIRRLEAVRVSHKIIELEKKVKSLQTQMKGVEKRVERLRRMREDFRSKRHEVEVQWRKFGADEIEEGQTHLLEIQIRIGDLKSSLSEVLTKISSGKASLDGLRRVRNNNLQQIEAIKKDIEESKNRLKHLNVEHHRISNEISAKQSKHEDLSKEAAELRENLDENTKKMRKVEEKLDNLYQRMVSLRSEYAKSLSLVRFHSQRLKDLLERKEDLISTSERLQKSLADLREVQKEQRERLRTLEKTLERRSVQKESIEIEVKEAKKIADSAREAVVEFSTQREIFEKIRSEENALRNIEELGELGVIPGVFGRLRNLIKIQRRYKQAIEAAAAGWLDSVVVQDLQVAFTCSETLRKLKLGRIKIIPLKGLSSIKKVTIPDIDGFNGPASTFVKYAKRYEPAISFVFGDTVVVSNYKAALMALEKGLRAVTLNGDLYEVGGGVESGFYRSPIDFSSIVPSESAVKSLDQAVRTLRDHLKKRESDIAEIEMEVLETRLEMTRLKEAMNRLEGEIRGVRRNVERTKRNVNRAERAIQRTQKVLEKERAKIGSYKLRRVKIRSEMLKLRRELADLRRKTDMSEIQMMEIERENLGNDIIGLRERLGTVETEMSTIQSKLENVLNIALKNAEIQIRKVSQQISRLEREIEEASQEKSRLTREISELEKSKEALSSSLLTSREEAKKFMSQIDSIDKQLRKLDMEYEQSDNLFHQIKFDLQALQLQLNQYREKLKDLGYSEPLKVSVERVRKAESSVRLMELELERIGAVNQLAQTQYLVQVSRYKELSIRMNELEEERMAILRFIEEIERKKRDVFMKAFKSVNENLKRYFSKLTGGGEAVLKLENPENPFSGGVDMIVQFPNKPPILIGGASSGERSVSAVAFLFAIQELTPASFYLLDEVDAHLDAFHVKRLGELLAEESLRSQFLVITLKPEMVSKAQKIYGIYGRNGVSRVVSTTLKGAA